MLRLFEVHRRRKPHRIASSEVMFSAVLFYVRGVFCFELDGLVVLDGNLVNNIRAEDICSNGNSVRGIIRTVFLKSLISRSNP